VKQVSFTEVFVRALERLDLRLQPRADQTGTDVRERSV
jgi:hypothetical protein